MATVVCIRIPKLPSKFAVTMPGMGQLTYMRDTLEKIRARRRC